jgi:hypothetical protein
MDVVFRCCTVLAEKPSSESVIDAGPLVDPWTSKSHSILRRNWSDRLVRRCLRPNQRVSPEEHHTFEFFPISEVGEGSRCCAALVILCKAARFAGNSLPSTIPRQPVPVGLEIKLPILCSINSRTNLNVVQPNRLSLKSAGSAVADRFSTLTGPRPLTPQGKTTVMMWQRRARLTCLPTPSAASALRSWSTLPGRPAITGKAPGILIKAGRSLVGHGFEPCCHW